MGYARLCLLAGIIKRLGPLISVTGDGRQMRMRKGSLCRSHGAKKERKVLRGRFSKLSGQETTAGYLEALYCTR